MIKKAAGEGIQPDMKTKIIFTDKKTTSIDYILQRLTQETRLHIPDMIEDYAMLMQADKANKTRRGYATAISNAIAKLEKIGKIKVVDFWEIESV